MNYQPVFTDTSPATIPPPAGCIIIRKYQRFTLPEARLIAAQRIEEMEPGMARLLEEGSGYL
jgi:hypothetical protein